MSTRFKIRLALLAVATTALGACGGDGANPSAGDGTGGNGGNGGNGGSGSGDGSIVNVAGVQLRSLSYTDSGNWQYKVHMQTLEDATADSNGYFARTEQYARSVEGAPQRWDFGPDPERADDLFWNGVQWRGCPLGYRTTLGSAVSGTRQFNYCDMYATGTESIIRTDVSGLTMSSVIFDIRTQPGGDGFILFDDYGPANLGVLGTTVFPAGSERHDVIQTVDAFAPRYTDSIDNRLRVYDANIAAGGVEGSNPTPACTQLDDTATTIDDISGIAVNLEQLIGSARGTPCVFSQRSNSSGTSLASHEWWEPSTIEFGELTGVDVRPVGTGNFYAETPSLRVAFTGAAQVTYYECLRTNPAWSDPVSIRNCTSRGTGSYRIESLGDARLISFLDQPDVFMSLSEERILIERDGRVAAGTRERAGVRDAAGFNDIATDALFRQMLIPLPALQ